MAIFTDELKQFKYRDIFKRLLKTIREYKRYVIGAIIAVACETLLECVIPFIMSLLIESLEKVSSGQIAQENILSIVITYSVILVVLAAASFGCGVTAGILSAKGGVGFATNLRQDFFYNTTKFSFSNIDKFSVSSLVTRQTSDISTIQNAFNMIIRVGIRSPLMLIFSVIMASIMAPTLAWIYAILVPVLVVVLILIIINVIPIFLRVFKKYDKLNESVEENVRGIRVVKTYVKEEYEKEKFNEKSEDIRKDFVRAERIIALNHPVMQTCFYLSMFLIIFLGGYYIVNYSYDTVQPWLDGAANFVDGALSVGDLTALITYGAQILSSLMMFQMIFTFIAMSSASLKRVYEVLVEVPTITSPENPIYEVENGDIDYKDVNFKYHEGAEKYALSDIDLHINSGEMVGIVGGTGSSKSTLVNLLSRFYDTTTGEVLVGGYNVKDYDITSLRNGVSMVLQKNVLFSGTIKENLRWGNAEATDEEIVEACKIAQADSFIETFPDKYDTYIQQGGTNVSGGQKQRLCIARAILKKPKILILDDSTSAVDTKTDALIRDGLRKTMKDTTKIIIAQRINSVMDADKIIVMDDGKINGVGTHEELLKTNKIYQEIYALQNRTGGK